MSKEELKGLEAHPLIVALEKQDTPAIQFRGFLGTGSESMIHLYTDISMSCWLEIPREAVLFWERDSHDANRVRLFVSSKPEIVEVTRSRFAAGTIHGLPTGVSGSQLSPTARRFFPKMDTCVGFCEREFASIMGQALEAFSNGQDALGRMLKQQAHEKLDDCLEGCQPLRNQTVMLPDGTIRGLTLQEVRDQIIQRVVGR